MLNLSADAGRHPAEIGGRNGTEMTGRIRTELGGRLEPKHALELSINAKSLWKSGSVEQKLELLRVVTSNRVLNGVNIEYNLNKPFGTISEMSKKESWRSQGDLLRYFAKPNKAKFKYRIKTIV